MYDMKNFKIFSLFLVLLILFSVSGCDDGFEALNENPNAAPTTSPDYLFTYSLKSAGSDNSLVELYISFLMKWTQQSAQTWEYQANPYDVTSSMFDNLWQEWYTRTLSNNAELIRMTKNDPALVNKNALARIWQVFIFHRLTDLWGDVPYTEALPAVENLNFKPGYSKQEDIYNDMLKELDEAVKSIDPKKVTYSNADILFKGNLDKWTRFGNSLRLRLAIRAGNQSVVTELMQKNLFISNNTENVVYNYLSDVNTQSIWYSKYTANPTSINNVSATVTRTMAGLKDPRLPVYAQTVKFVNYAGKEIDTIIGATNLVKKETGYTLRPSMVTTSSTGTFFLRPDGPNPLITYSEVCLLKAEAALRGWGATEAQAETFYNEGIRANMQYFESVDANGKKTAILKETDITTYLAGLAKFKTTGTKAERFKQIMTQKWITLYYNGLEVYAEYRRTILPDLYEPVITKPTTKIKQISGYNLVTPYSATSDNLWFPWRITYPQTELNLNRANYDKAVGDLGQDSPTAKFWWIKKWEEIRKSQGF
jgi:hypothetical protein